LAQGFDAGAFVLAMVAVAQALRLIESHACGAGSGAFVQEGQDSRQARRYFVSGSVQGVGYRYFASRVAERLDVAGYARNLRDGRVEVYAIGAPAKLAALRKELEHGPQSAMVSGVAEEDAAIEPQFEDDFSIEHGLH
jgi:acylphosphatase